MNQTHTSQRLYVTSSSHLVNAFFQKCRCKVTSSMSYDHTTKWFQAIPIVLFSGAIISQQNSSTKKLEIPTIEQKYICAPLLVTKLS